MSASIAEDAGQHPWRAAGFRYHAYNYYLRRRFEGRRIQRISLDAGFTCPNVDGTVARGGCNFCDNRSFSPSRRERIRGLAAQLETGISKVRRRYPDVAGFLAYFQPATNTYAPVDRLRGLYETALNYPGIRGLVIGTRPDCVPPEVLELLSELARKAYVSVELGMQTIHDASLDWMNRGHHHSAMIDAVARSRGRGFEIGTHVILGLPGESHADMMATAREVARLGIDSVKLHNLYAVRRTPLGDQFERGEVPMMDLETYVRTLVDFLELLPPRVVVERISGDAPPDYLLGPEWCLDKPAIRRAMEAEFLQRDTYQGRRWEPSPA